MFPVCWFLAGPVGRLLTSARMYQNNLKVLIFCRLVGVVDGYIPSAGWHFFLQVLHCVKALQGDGWQGLVQVRPYYCVSFSFLLVLRYAIGLPGTRLHSN